MLSRRPRHLRPVEGTGSQIGVDPGRFSAGTIALVADPTICPVLGSFAAVLLDAGIDVDLDDLRGTRRSARSSRANAHALAAWAAQSFLGLPPRLTLQAYYAGAAERSEPLAESVREVLSLAIAGAVGAVGADVGEIVVGLVKTTSA